MVFRLKHFIDTLSQPCNLSLWLFIAHDFLLVEILLEWWGFGEWKVQVWSLAFTWPYLLLPCQWDLAVAANNLKRTHEWSASSIDMACTISALCAVIYNLSLTVHEYSLLGLSLRVIFYSAVYDYFWPQGVFKPHSLYETATQIIINKISYVSRNLKKSVS